MCCDVVTMLPLLFSMQVGATSSSDHDQPVENQHDIERNGRKEILGIAPEYDLPTSIVLYVGSKDFSGSSGVFAGVVLPFQRLS